MSEITGLTVALGLALDRLEGASASRPPSEDREHLIADDNMAIKIGRDLIEYHWQKELKNGLRNRTDTSSS